MFLLEKKSGLFVCLSVRIQQTVGRVGLDHVGMVAIFEVGEAAAAVRHKIV